MTFLEKGKMNDNERNLRRRGGTTEVTRFRLIDWRPRLICDTVRADSFTDYAPLRYEIYCPYWDSGV